MSPRVLEPARLPRVRALHATIALAGLLVACSGDDDADAPASTEVPVKTTDEAPSTVVVDTTAAVEGFTFTPPEDDYSVVFPAEPTATEQTVTLPDGRSLPITFYLLEQDGTARATAAATYPAGTAVTLEGSRDGAIATISATLTESTPITQQGRDGLQFSADVQHGTGTYLSHIYVDGVRLYQVIVIVSGPASFDDPDVAAFFDSFRFAEV